MNKAKSNDKPHKYMISERREVVVSRDTVVIKREERDNVNTEPLIIPPKIKDWEQRNKQRRRKQKG